MSATTSNYAKKRKSTTEESIRLKINLNQEGDKSEEVIKIKRRTKLQKLIDSIGTHRSLDTRGLEFLYNGNRIRGNKTPEQLGMEDGDEIDVMLHAGGGSMTVQS